MTHDQAMQVSDASRNRYSLTKWERNFIVGLRAKPVYYELSDKQERILKRITEKLNGV